MSEEFADFVGHLSDNARTSLYYADSIARGYGSTHIGTEYLLLGILAQGASVGAKILADAGVTLDRAEQALELRPGLRRVKIGVNTLSESAQVSLKLAWQSAQEYGSDRLGTEHMLRGLLVQEKSKASRLLADIGIDIDVLVQTIDAFLEKQSQHSQQQEAERAAPSAKSLLQRYGVDLVEQARQGKLDPVIGRHKEVERMVTIVSRRRKNNPLLIGEPGVGKTAIVEGLAARIATRNVPDHLCEARIIQLDLAAIIAGTKYRGEFEERLKKLIDTIAADPYIIVFIDELHLLVGAGSAEGSMDAANLLKPALARGELRLIGATTFDEYKKYIEKDSALERRFQTIITKEPSVQEARAIVRGLRDRYQSHHDVTIDDDVLADAVFLADRYIKDRQLPDKAIDVIDEAAAMVRVRHNVTPLKARQLASEIAELEADIEAAVAKEDYETAAVRKSRLLQLQKQHERYAKKRHKPVPLSSDDIARAVAQIAGVPVEKLQKSEQAMLLSLEAHLAKKLIGQADAIKKVSQVVRRNRSGIASPSRPIGSFIFMGPTGVGKTELARVLAEEVFGGRDALVKIDMSEFAEKHTASRLLGAPAGYVGYDDGGQLTDTIRRQPYSVVLFDEIEKAHLSVFQLLLQLLEDGKLTDGKGRTVDFSNTIIILTSNLGADEMQKETELGFSAVSLRDRQNLAELHEKNAYATKKALEKFMRPELINRFDHIVTFQALTKQEVGKVADLLLADVAERLAQKGVVLKVRASAKRLLVEKGYSKQFGARQLRRTIEELLEPLLADKLLRGELAPGAVATVTSKKKQLEVEVGYETT